MKVTTVLLKFLLGLFGLGMLAGGAQSAVVWTFDLPAVGSFSPPYPVIATLTAEQVGDGVLFTLDPDETNPGFTLPPADRASNFKELDFVYSGVALTAADFSHIAGVFITGFAYLTNPNNMEGSYKSSDEHIVVTFANGFTADLTSSWLVRNTFLADFTGPSATASSPNMPSPTLGIVSVAPFTNPDMSPANTSKWVSGPPAIVSVPLPSTALLLGLGLVGLMGLRRR